MKSKTSSVECETVRPQRLLAGGGYSEYGGDVGMLELIGSNLARQEVGMKAWTRPRKSTEIEHKTSKKQADETDLHQVARKSDPEVDAALADWSEL